MMTVWTYPVAPLQHLLEYNPVLYSLGLHDPISIYQSEPSREVDEAWENLYNGGQTVTSHLIMSIDIVRRLWYKCYTKGTGRATG